MEKAFRHRHEVVLLKLGGLGHHPDVSTNIPPRVQRVAYIRRRILMFTTLLRKGTC